MEVFKVLFDSVLLFIELILTNGPTLFLKSEDNKLQDVVLADNSILQLASSPIEPRFM